MKIAYPFIPKGRKIYYVPDSNSFIRVAAAYAYAYSLDDYMPNASIIVKQNKILGLAANGSDYHKSHPCRRKLLGIPTGQGYELCEGCHPKHHSEGKAIADAQKKHNPVKGADLYLWGHWWCCEPCWENINKAGISNVYLLKGSAVLFNREVEGNIVGNQFQHWLKH